MSTFRIPDPVIQVSGFRKTYGRTGAVDEVSMLRARFVERSGWLEKIRGGIYSSGTLARDLPSGARNRAGNLSS